MHYLVTGHTGFKGSWLVLLLNRLGHTVSGISLDPQKNSLFELANVAGILEHDFRIDIRDKQALQNAINIIKPDVVMHLAAQALVRESYINPRFTFETNAIGTLNVLESVHNENNVKATLIITTDKVYRNVDQPEGYKEDDPLGGDDPYSSSKAMADLLTQSWVKSFPGSPVAIARAGNVIGGGDVCTDRLIVDLIKGFESAEPILIRYPKAVRPWQHVLDCLAGYLQIVDDLLAGPQRTTWNIGPLETSFISVGEMADEAVSYWGERVSWIKDPRIHPHEANLLMLDATNARNMLNWGDKVPYPQSLYWTLDWYKQVAHGKSPIETSLQQLSNFLSL